MDKNSNDGGFRASLQRLKEGLQKTIQIFRVYESDTDDNYSGPMYNQPGVRPQFQNARNIPKTPQVRFNRRGYPQREEEMETEISAVELESDWDVTSLDSDSETTIMSMNSSIGLCRMPPGCDSVTDDNFSMGSKSYRSEYSNRIPPQPGFIPKDSHTAAMDHRQPRRIPLPRRPVESDLEQVSDSNKIYSSFGRKQPVIKRQVSLSSFVDYPYSVKKSPSAGTKELPPKKPPSFYSSDHNVPPIKKQPTSVPIMGPIGVLPEKPTKSFMIEDKCEGPINHFNYALVFPDKTNEMRLELRYLLANLERHGLELELVRGEHHNANLVFVLIHMPMATLVNEVQKQKVRFSCMLPYYPVEEPTKLHWFTMCFSQFSEEPKVDHISNFVTSAEKIVFIHQRINRTKFGDEPEHYGIDEMIREEIITAAFPLHDGDAHPSWLKPLSDRQNLTAFWGRLSRFTYLQPLRLVNKYFGPEIAFYFAWLGYLSCFLTSVTIFGIFVLVAAIISLSDPADSRIHDVCNSDQFMCPLCLHYEHCDFSAVKDSCFYARMNYVFDNKYTPAYGIFLAIWTLVCIIYWQRAENALKMEWNLYHTNMENFLRSAFLRRLKEQHIETPYKGEPRIPFVWRCMTRLLVMVMLAAMIALLCVIVFVLALIQISLTHKLAYRVARNTQEERANVALISNGCYSSNLIVSVVSGVFIIIFSKIFPYFVNGLVILEGPRTEREYIVSYTNKVFILECFNNYGFSFYLAFFREFGFVHPGYSGTWTHSGGILRNLCDPSGCFADLSIYIAIVLSIKILYYWIETGIFAYRNLKSNPIMVSTEQWDSDYTLTNVNYRFYITTLYMEPVMKYGLVVCFGVAFPLAPLLLLIDTAVTIRINAMMFCQLLRRPVPRRVEGLEIWDGILQIVSVFGMIVNVYVLAFATDVAKRNVHMYFNNNDPTGYFKHTISEYRVADYPSTTGSSSMSTCYFRGHRKRIVGNDYAFTDRSHYITLQRHCFTFLSLIGLLVFGVFFYFLIWNYAREKPYDESVDNKEEEEELEEEDL